MHLAGLLSTQEARVARGLGPDERPYFTRAASNASKRNPLFSLISIQFGSCEVQRLTRALTLHGVYQHE